MRNNITLEQIPTASYIVNSGLEELENEVMDHAVDITEHGITLHLHTVFITLLTVVMVITYIFNMLYYDKKLQELEDCIDAQNEQICYLEEVINDR